MSDFSKLKESADENFKFDENGRKLSKWVKKTLWEKEKLLATTNFSFSLSVFKGASKGVIVWEWVNGEFAVILSDSLPHKENLILFCR